MLKAEKWHFEMGEMNAIRTKCLNMELGKILLEEG